MTGTVASNDTLWSGPFGDDYTARNQHGRERRHIVRETVAELQPLRLLEVGCNLGLNLRGIEGMVPRIVGVDVNHGALEQLRRVCPSVQAVVAPAQRLPFLDGEFDLVVCIGVLIHIPTADLGAVMDELVRVTRGGGHILTGNYEAPEEVAVPYHGQEAALWKRPYHALFREGRPVEAVWSKYLDAADGWDRVSFDFWRKR